MFVRIINWDGDTVHEVFTTQAQCAEVVQAIIWTMLRGDQITISED